MYLSQETVYWLFMQNEILFGQKRRHLEIPEIIINGIERLLVIINGIKRLLVKNCKSDICGIQFQFNKTFFFNFASQCALGQVNLSLKATMKNSLIRHLISIHPHP